MRDIFNQSTNGNQCRVTHIRLVVRLAIPIRLCDTYLLGKLLSECVLFSKLTPISDHSCFWFSVVCICPIICKEDDGLRSVHCIQRPLQPLHGAGRGRHRAGMGSGTAQVREHLQLKKYVPSLRWCDLMVTSEEEEKQLGPEKPTRGQEVQAAWNSAASCALLVLTLRLSGNWQSGQGQFKQGKWYNLKGTEPR